MRLSLAWLNELLGAAHEAHALARLLTHAGLVVDEIIPAPDGDHVLAAEVTTNRPDWLGHHGVAREIAALTGASFRPPDVILNETGPDLRELTSVVVEPDALRYCPRYTARVLRGVRVGPSPDWLRRRLEAVGQRSINNIVDATNLVCFEMNQPLHAFDLDQLAGRRIVVRMARDGEPFAAITGEKGVLTRERLVIADARDAVALAGVKGGENSGVTEATRDVLIEAAWFEPAQVRRAGRALKMASESSYRFERGVDPGGVERAGARAAQLMLELAGGALARGVIDTGPDLAKPRNASLRFARCQSLLGFRFPDDEIAAILTGLGMAVVSRDAAGLTVAVPSWRRDATREVDLIEEVARVGGYGRIPPRVSLPLTMAAVPPMIEAARAAREVLAGLGYHECFSDAFIPEGWAEPFADPASGGAYRIRNPINAERTVLRLSLCPSLLEVRRINRTEPEARLFEINRTYHKTDQEGPKEVVRLAILDDRGPEYARGALEETAAFLKRAESPALSIPESGARAGFAPGTRAELRMGAGRLAEFGLVSDEEVRRHDLARAPGLLEADLAVLAEAPKRSRWYQAPPRYPAVRRDIALVVPEATRWADVEARAREAAEAAPGVLEAVRLESVYRGKGLSDGEKSLAFAMTLRSAAGSLTDETANAIRDAVGAALCARVPGAHPR